MSEPAVSDPAPRGRWLRRLLLALYVASCFIIGAVYIYLGSLNVEHQVELWGQPHALAGEPLQVVATARLPPGSGATLRVDLVDGSRSLATGEAALRAGDDGRASADLSLLVPAGVAPGAHALSVTLDAERSPIQELTTPILVSDPAAPEPRVEELRPAQAMTDEPLMAELIPAGGVNVPFIESVAHVRVTDAQTSAPIDRARVRLDRTYGEATLLGPSELVTDALGLASLRFQANGESDWRLTITAPDGRVAEHVRTLRLVPAGVQVTPRQRVVGPDGVIAVTARSVQESATLYLDVSQRDAWLGRLSQTKPDEAVSVSWRMAQLTPPSRPTLLTLTACLTAFRCGDSANRLALLWSQAPPASPRGVAEAVLALAPHVRYHDRAYAAHVRALMPVLSLDSPAFERLLDVLLSRVAADALEPTVLLDTDAFTLERLDAARDRLRGQANVVMALLLLGGGLLLAASLIASSLRRRRDLARVIDEGSGAAEGDADGEVHAHLEAQRRLRNIGGAIEVGVVALTIVVFVWGLYLLFQRL